jgi:hypothetical protein
VLCHEPNKSKKLMSQLAIVGAGVSGLATAWSLRASRTAVTVFEKSRGYSGRAATRRRGDLCYDHGANYFKTPTPDLERIVQDELPSDDLVAIERDVWTFEKNGTIQPGDPASNADPKWTYRRGINTLGKHLAGQAAADVRLETRIERIERADGRWRLIDTGGTAYGPFDGVVLTPPAPQTQDLVRSSAIDQDAQHALLSGLGEAEYTSQFTIVLGYDRRLARPDDFYALLNTDREHAIAWLSFEEDKPGHIPEGQSVLILQMAPDWTEAHFEGDPDALVQKAAAHAEELLGTACTAPAWSDTQRWRYALPTTAADEATLQDAEAEGLFVTGDVLVGKGRVHRALEEGLRCAERVEAYLH